MEDRYCLECGIKLTGRVDKKFCSDQCRNTYNNRLNKDETAYMSNVNRILRKNRRILKELTPEGKAKVKKQTLISRDFNFKYFTNIYKTKEGKIYYFCYEHGYLPLDNDYFALVVNKNI
jgi:predicted nucleic acid-binding Zn ribbon protein